MNDMAIDNLTDKGRTLVAGWARGDADRERAAVAIVFEQRPLREVAKEVGRSLMTVHGWAVSLRRFVAEYLKRTGESATVLVIPDEYEYDEFQDEPERPSGWRESPQGGGEGPDDG